MPRKVLDGRMGRGRLLAKKANKKPLRGGTVWLFQPFDPRPNRGSGQVHRGINQPYYDTYISISNLTYTISRLNVFS